MRPLVGITAWRRELDTYYGPDRLQTLSTHYTDAVAGAGMDPVIFPAGLDPARAAPLVDLVDGIVLSGGSDIDPATYGEENTHSYDMSREADLFEIAVVEAARERDKPLLAICRGLQMLNVALGGTLLQEVGSAGTAHEPVSRDHVEMSTRRHVVTFEDDSILSAMYGESEVKVNSLHHQGLARLSDELVVEGRSDDGLVEAARFGGSWWALGVQWHPERLEGAHRRIFTLFRAEMSRDL